MSRVEVRIETPLAGLTRGAIERAVLAALEAEGADLRVGVTVVDDDRIRRINARHLRHDWATDVISFDLREEDDGAPDDDSVDGDLVVSATTAAREAAERGVEPVGELLLYCIHGTLHLLGWDDHDEDDRRAMHARQAEILKRIGYETSP